MSGDLGNLLTGELGEAEARFSHEDFAALYGRRIAGRVRRRRAVRAAGVGGGTMLTAGALVVGVTQVPWGTLGATTGVGASDCVTPSATDGWRAHSASIDTSEATSGELVINDFGNDTTILRGVQQPDGTFLFTDAQGNPLSATPGVGGYYTVELPPGAYYDDVTRSISLEPGGAGSVSSQQATSTPSAATGSYIYEVTVVPGVVRDATVRLTDPANGTTILSATLQPDGSYYFADMYGIQAAATLEVTGQYLVTVPQGPPISSGGVPDPGAGEILVNSIRSAGVEAPDGSASPSASDDCFTADPTPSSSPSLSIDYTYTVEPSLAAKPEEIEGSPFQCGFEFPADNYATDALSIDDAEWFTPEEVESKSSQSGGRSVTWGSASPDALVPRVTVHYDMPSSAKGETASGVVGTGEPSLVKPGEPGADASSTYDYAKGRTFVGVREGRVVATGSRAADDSTDLTAIFTARDGFQVLESELMYLIDPSVALKSCDANPVDLANVDIVAVAGLALQREDGTSSPTVYSWLPVGKP